MHLERTVEHFLKKGYAVRVFETKEEARDALCAELVGESIGFGGSATLDELGLYDALSEKNRVVWHWRCPEGKTPRRTPTAGRGMRRLLFLGERDQRNG